MCYVHNLYEYCYYLKKIQRINFLLSILQNIKIEKKNANIF